MHPAVQAFPLCAKKLLHLHGQGQMQESNFLLWRQELSILIENNQQLHKAEKLSITLAQQV
jgi:hypothetical protein